MFRNNGADWRYVNDTLEFRLKEVLNHSKKLKGITK